MLLHRRFSSISYSFLTRVIVAFFGLAFILTISRSLSREEQGLFYSLSSIVGYLSLADLGYSAALTTKLAKLRDFNNKLSSEKISESHEKLITSYVISCVINISFVLVLCTSIYAFLTIKGSFSINLDLISCWLLMLLGTFLVLILNIFISAIDGFKGPFIAYKLRFFLYGSQSIFTFIFLIYLKNILFYPFALISSALLTIIILVKYYGNLIRILLSRNLIFIKYKDKILEINALNDFKSFRNKLGISFVTGYITTQSITPFILSSIGSGEAGKWGLTIQMLQNISVLSLAIAVPSTSDMSEYVERNLIKKYLNYFSKRSLQSLILYLIFLGFSFFLIYTPYFQFFNLSDSVLDIKLFSLLGFGFLSLNISILISIIYRANNKEPFVFYNLFVSILIITLTSKIGSTYGIYGVTIFYTLISIITGISAVIWLRIFLNRINSKKFLEI